MADNISDVKRNDVPSTKPHEEKQNNTKKHTAQNPSINLQRRWEENKASGAG